MHGRHGARGFTVIELLIVILIIGGLAYLGVPMNRGSSERRRVEDCRATLEAWNAELRRFPEGTVDELGFSRGVESSRFPQPERRNHRDVDGFPYFRVLGTDEVACRRHGLFDFDRHRSARAQLAEAGVTDPATLKLVSERPVSEIERQERVETVGIGTFGGAMLLFLLAEIGYLIARFESARKDEAHPQRVAIAVGMFLAGAALGGGMGWARIPKDAFARKVTLRATPISPTFR